MPDRAAIAFLGILQRHGLTNEVLEFLASHCEAKHTGVMMLHTSNGDFQMCEVGFKWRLANLRGESGRPSYQFTNEGVVG